MQYIGNMFFVKQHGQIFAYQLLCIFTASVNKLIFVFLFIQPLRQVGYVSVIHNKPSKKTGDRYAKPIEKYTLDVAERLLSE